MGGWEGGGHSFSRDGGDIRCIAKIYEGGFTLHVRSQAVSCFRTRCLRQEDTGWGVWGSAL